MNWLQTLVWVAVILFALGFVWAITATLAWLDEQLEGGEDQ